jgi:sortase A
LAATDWAALDGIHSLDEKITYLARLDLRRIRTGDAIAQIDIPRIGQTYNVVQGTGTRSLEEGPGHYPSTALPGMGETVAIAGHRTTYLAPFRFLNELTAGDRVIVTMPYGRFTYIVQYQRVVVPTDWWITDNRGYDRLVLSACNPLYSASQRIVVFARLRSVQPLGPARAAA